MQFVFVRTVAIDTEISELQTDVYTYMDGNEIHDFHAIYLQHVFCGSCAEFCASPRRVSKHPASGCGQD